MPSFPHPEKPDVQLRAWDDVDTTRQLIFDNVKDAVTKRYPVESADFRLELADVDYHKPKKYTIEEQRQAILNRRNVDQPLTGEWRLFNRHTNELVGKSRKVVARVPYLTDRGTFILNGSEWSLGTQQRLRPGVYSRKKANGELESHANLLPGTGRSFRMFMEPETGRFRFQIGQGFVPAYPILRALGVEDQHMSDAWGQPIMEANRTDSKFNLQRAYAKFADAKTRTAYPDPTAGIRAIFTKSEVDPNVVARTLGKPYKNLSGEALTRALQKLLHISQGQEEEDDRDSQSNQVAYGPEDLIPERVRKDAGGVVRGTMWQLARSKDPSKIPSNLHGKQLLAAITASGVGQTLQEISPIEINDQLYRVTRMGVGGIPSDQAIPDEARNVHPSQMGLIDIVKTQESNKIGVDVRATGDSFKGSDGSIYRKVSDRLGKDKFVNAVDMAAATVAFPSEDRDDEVVRAIRNGRIVNVPPSEVDYWIPHGESLFTLTSLLVPALSSIKGGRLLMGGKFFTQSLSLDNPEAPLVQGLSSDGRTFEHIAGKSAGAMYSDVEGTVVKVTPNSIVVRDSKGNLSEKALYNNFVYNQKSLMHNTPTVAVGDKVKPGQLLARSNFTDKDGSFAPGTNLRVAYLPLEGTYEDSLLISQSAARKLSSLHMYPLKFNKQEGDEVSKNKFLGIFPGKYTKEQLSKLDDNGVVKPGTIVNPGDPVVLAVGVQQPGTDKGVLKQARNWFVDRAMEWDGTNPGQVIDTGGKDDLKITVKTVNPMNRADKLTNRGASKGVISEPLPDDQMPRDKDGVPFELIINPLTVVSRCYDDQTEFNTLRGWKKGSEVLPDDILLTWDPISQNTEYSKQLEPMYVQDYQGELVHNSSRVVDICVTPNHKMWARCRYPGADWQETTAGRLLNHSWYIPVAGNPTTGEEETPFDLPPIEGAGEQLKSPITIDAGDWAEFMGWFLSEGSTSWYEGKDKREYKTHISQSIEANPAKTARIKSLLERLPFKFHYSSKNSQFHINSKRLTAYCRQFGKSRDKWIPEWVFSQPYEIRQRFLDALWAGDGNVGVTQRGSRYSRIKTNSKELMDGVQRLLLLQGVCSSVNHSPPDPRYPGSGPMWYVGVHFKENKDRLLASHNWKVVDYFGKVYCPTVSTGYVFVRRNGKVCIAGNTNPTVMAEALLGKIARKTGKRYALPPFRKDSLIDFTLNELKKHGVSETETVFDPRSNRYLPNVFTGEQFIMKLAHMADDKWSARDSGVYTMDNTPASGSVGKSKRVGGLELSALISSGATNVLRDFKLVRGQRNDEYWQQLRMGGKPKPPTENFIYRKFLNMLRASGVRVKEGNDKLQVMPLTDKHADELIGNRFHSSGDAVSIKDDRAVPGGLYDMTLTGGRDGNRWSGIKLHTPLPNPIMEDPIIRLMRLTGPKFQELLASENGPQAIHDSLARLNIDNEIEAAKIDIKSGKLSTRSNAVKRLRTLTMLKKEGIRPEELMITRVPVIPPKFRPLAMMNGMQLSSDSNLLYKDLWEANEAYKDVKETLGEAGAGQERVTLYNALKSISGMGEPVNPKNQEKGVAGLLVHIFGKGASKTGLFQRKLLAGTVDSVARGVITPDSDLNIDEIGLPEEYAWELYRPYIMRRLARRYNLGGIGGSQVPMTDLAKWVADRNPKAKEALLDELKERPVIYSRAPVWHKYGILGGNPVLVPGNAIRLSPLNYPGLGGDNDGDAINIHVPSMDEAIKDVREKMMPSRMLWQPSNFKLTHIPRQEYLIGLWEATRSPKGETREFASEEDAIAAYNRGEITLRTPIKILK